MEGVNVTHDIPSQRHIVACMLALQARVFRDYYTLRIAAFHCLMWKLGIDRNELSTLRFRFGVYSFSVWFYVVGKLDSSYSLAKKATSCHLISPVVPPSMHPFHALSGAEHIRPELSSL